VRYGDVVLWHYGFARSWFKVNPTTDLSGRIAGTGGDEPGSGLRRLTVVSRQPSGGRAASSAQ
jgi:hypothetical protein